MFKKILACLVSRRVIVIALFSCLCLKKPAGPMFIELSYSCDDRKLFCELASTCYLAASGFCEERKSTLRLTEHSNIFLNTYPVVVFSHLSLQPLRLCTRSQQCFTTATIPSGSAILNISNYTSLYCVVAFTRCE